MAESAETKEARKQNAMSQALLSKRQNIINDEITDPKVKRVIGQLLLMSENDVNAALETLKRCSEAELTQEEREKVLERFAESSALR